MSESNSLKFVQEAYAAFGRGDLLEVLNHLAEDVIWNAQYPSEVPFGGEWRGHQEVAQFFTTLNTTLEVKDFTVVNWISQDDTVVVQGHETAQVKSTNSEYKNEWIHIWKLKQGKAAEIKTYNDTATVSAAFQP